MRVMKFGGTSVGDAARFQRVADLIALHRASDPQLAVVVSAMAGVTDALIRMSHLAARGEPDWIPALAALRNRHQDTVQALSLPGEEARALEVDLQEGFERVETVLQAVAALRELSPSTADLVAGMGERWSARILAAVLRARGIPARAVDADAFLVTDDRFGEASPDLEQTRVRARAHLLPLLEQGVLPVVTGFIGATPEGRPTTLGRGGSDFSATILGYALDAEEVWIWTDVDGVMSADPKIVPGAHTIPELSYIEAAEMAYFGAKVLHPRTLLPCIDRRIPVRILNTMNPQHPGTWIVPEPRGNGQVKAVTLIKNLSLITVEGRGMLGVPGVAARTFAAVAELGVSILMISQSSSEQNICFVIPSPAAAQVVRALRKAFEREMARRDIEDIWAMDRVAVIAVVGAGLRATPGIAARVFNALGNGRINILSIAQGSSEYNLSLVVAESEAEEAVRRIHAAFYEQPAA
ncbi:aspartate kinase [Thermoflexus sp.]|uniref:aspartate kinase n=1 Tax=Thermoflexus sp. TaxID=1969742 RepID=UPI0025F7485E|nr:aspartate kinase [Thermoflexus sp.]MDW8180037.1 aspartate kinase [Anaerolineae bacterium]MCS6964022.1 aspartate kinase [Thermoflexus sp.]MCS7350586.1 aspartate kinase [Thermoflexus sp.]MCX7690697.1 aspartate kinase [Thermoflexus sp.]MDW8186203.1 aspartate kinase [Anaerolineae bacterium]